MQIKYSVQNRNTRNVLHCVVEPDDAVIITWTPYCAHVHVEQLVTSVSPTGIKAGKLRSSSVFVRLWILCILVILGNTVGLGVIANINTNI